MELNIVQPEEVDFYVQSIRESQIADIGGKSWLEAHERLLKLNQQAIVEATGNREEILKELLILQDKFPLLVHEIYCVLVWRTKILPKLLKSGDKIEATFFIYTVLYHESTAVSLLETVLYHENSCEALGDAVIDLIDYCVHGVTQLIGLTHDGHQLKTSKVKIEMKPLEELEEQQNDLQFGIGMKCVTILSYLSDKISSLSVSAARRLTQTHDVPCLISELLSIRPWMRRIKNFEKFVDGRWTPVEGDEILKIVKVEAQTWFCLRSIMFHRETFENYEINSFRQRELGKCSGLLNDVILDQLPPLAELKQFLCTLQLSTNIPNSLNSLVLEVVPEVTFRLFFSIKKLFYSSVFPRRLKTR
jgi:zinc finger MYND domain-containing protein 10